ncbi:MAG: lipopolysaccharide assembly protein LapB [Betaproteobacteria bacterium]|nr:lipopolysaccharide assembly protein LapB [Betaproteobacteria bacterium]
MDFEFTPVWLLALPIAFGLGWLAARIDIRHLVRESRALPRSYLAGLNFLLNEQPDKAIDAFLEAVKIDPQTVELHFALGNLFRRRGEIDRAIRMHQTLVDRDDLNAEQRAQALSELGQDFLKAGLLDRAEAVFVKLRETGLRQVALKQLLELYQQEKDWQKAIEVAKSLPNTDSTLMLREIANFHCELALDALARGHFDESEKQLERAFAVNRQSVRASIILGDLRLAKGDARGALEAWQQIERQNPIYIAMVAERMMEAFRRLDDQASGVQLLHSYFERYPSLDLLDAVFQWELERDGPQAAYALVREELRRNPTVLGLDKLLEAAVLTASPEQRQDIELIKGLIHTHTRRVARYRCEDCGFKARQFYWRCPACGGWETYPPRRTEEFDLTP